MELRTWAKREKTRDSRLDNWRENSREDSMKNIIVKRTGRTWSIFVDGVLVEGGFFSRLAADHAAREWEQNA